MLSPAQGEQENESSRDPSLIATGRVSGCANRACPNRACPNQEPRQQRPKRHSAGPAEKHHCSRRSDARRQIQLQTQRRPDDMRRSEEHTSELQSHLNLVCRLLLEKKKKKNT